MVSDQTSIQLLQVAEHQLAPSADTTNRIVSEKDQQNQRYAGDLTGTNKDYRKTSERY